MVKALQMYLILCLVSSLFLCNLNATAITTKVRPVTKTPIVKPKVVTTKESIVVIGYCCRDGELFSSDEKKCKKKRGNFFLKKKEAEKQCKGSCCINGKIDEMSAKACRSKKGDYFASLTKAQQKCTGYCCVDFKVSQTTEKKCKSNHGKYFGKEVGATKYCQSQKGFCCTDGEIKKLTENVCIRKKGTFYIKNDLATSKCKKSKGYCNIEGRTLQLTKKECTKRKGSYFDTQRVAKSKLLPLKKKAIVGRVKTPKNAVSEKVVDKNISSSVGVHAVRKVPRPDLLPTRIWVEKSNCELWVEWENKGSATPAKSFTERYSIHGRFHHGSQSLTNYTFDSGQNYAITSPFKLNHGVTDLYPITIDGPTVVRFSIDGTNVHVESDENNNQMAAKVDCLSALKPLAPARIKAVETIGGGMQIVPYKVRGKTQEVIKQKPIPLTPAPAPLPDPLNDLNMWDLTIESITLDNMEPRIGYDGFEVTVIVKNRGPDAQPTDHPGAFFSLAQSTAVPTGYEHWVIPQYSIQIPLLGPGEEYEYRRTTRLPWSYRGQPLEAGQYKIMAFLDTTNYQNYEMREIDVTNNSLVKNFTVRDPAPSDLAIKDTVSLTQDCLVKFMIENRAAKIDDQDFNSVRITLSKDGGSALYKNLSEIDPSGKTQKAGQLWMPSETVTYVWPINGSYERHTIGLESGESGTFTINIDPYNSALRDSKRSNNIKIKSLHCQ